MADTAARVRPFGIIHEHGRSTYRTGTQSGYERFSKVSCNCVRIIDLEVQLSQFYPIGVWILVYDTHENDPANLPAGLVSYLPAKFVTPGNNVFATPHTEWIPFNCGILVVASANQVLDTSLVGDDIISTYCRYQNERGC